MLRYEKLTECVGENTLRKDYEGIIFGTKYYVGLVYNQVSYERWLTWAMERPAEERVLWAHS